MARIATLCALASFAIPLFAQQPTIRTTVPLVQVPVTITDKKGRFVYGLTANDFVLLDDGQPVAARLDDPDTISAPLAVIVLIQTTDISDSALLKIRKVASVLSEAVVGANGVAAVITYSDQVQLLQSLTDDYGALKAAFRDLKSRPARQGRMMDGVAKALDLLGSRPAGARSVIVVIGESKDRGSETKLEAILPVLQRSAATVYCLEYSAFLTPFTTKASEYSPPEGGRGWILDSITEAAHATEANTAKILVTTTGGRIWKFETRSGLENDLIGLGADIRSRYQLSFTPANSAPGKFHHLTVQVKNRPDLVVRARTGYWPSGV